MSQKQYELRFEGPKDSSASTLRQIKGVFVADLEFPIADVQRFIESAPVSIKQADSETELKSAQTLLEKAGAKVLIIKTSDQLNPDELELLPLELEFEQVLDQSPAELVKDKEVAPLELSFDFKTENSSDISINPEFTNELEINELETPSNISPTAEPEYDLTFAADLSLEIEDSPIIKAEEPVVKDIEANSEQIANSGLTLEPELQEATKTLEIRTDEAELDLYMPAGSTLLGNDHANMDSQDSSSTTDQASESQTEQNLNQSPDITDDQSIDTRKVSAQENDEIVEMTLEQLKSLQSSGKKKKSLIPLIVTTLVCCAILAYINSLLFSTNTVSNPFDLLVASLPQPATQDKKSDSKVLTENANTAWYTSQNVFSDRNYKASVWVENKLPVHASIEINAPRPAALSKEEIVNKVPERVWLKRIDIKDLIFKKENDLFIASGPALGYFQIGERNLRVSGEANITARIGNNSNDITLEVRASSNYKQTELSDSADQVPNLRFGLNSENASGKDYFSYIENILVKKP